MFNAKFLAEGITSKITLFISAIHTLRPVNDATEGSTQVAPMRAS